MDKDRLLIFGHTSIDKTPLLEVIHPSATKDNIQQLEIKTKYYTTEIDLWIDSYDVDLASWCSDYGTDDLKDVRAVIRGICYLFEFKDVGQLKGELQKIDEVFGEEWDGLKCCVGYGEPHAFEDFEDVCLSAGWECVQLQDQREFNEFRERVGGGRLKEVIESHGWTVIEKTDGVEQDFEIEDMLNMINEERERILKLPEDQRGDEALKVIERLNLS